MISETRERFLRAIVAKIPAEQIVEIHFFQPIKQGGVESGVAVVAADDAVTAAPALDGGIATVPPTAAPPHDGGSPPGAEIAGGTDEGEDASPAIHGGGEPEATAAPHADRASEAEPPDAEREEADDLVAADEGVNGEAHEPAARGTATTQPARAEASLVSDDIPTESALDDLVSGEDWSDADIEEPAEMEARPARFAVYTAHYRLVLKGIDRGKWESSVVVEADAPLLTIETVVRGVQRRSGDVEDATRMTGAEVRAELARMETAARVKLTGRVGR